LRGERFFHQLRDRSDWGDAQLIAGFGLDISALENNRIKGDLGRASAAFTSEDDRTILVLDREAKDAS
jgi:hypothetical protein